MAPGLPELPEEILWLVSRTLEEGDKKRMRLASSSCYRAVNEGVTHLQDPGAPKPAPISFSRFTCLESVRFTCSTFLGSDGVLVKSCRSLQTVSLSLDALSCVLSTLCQAVRGLRPLCG